MKIKILKKNILKENCGGPAEPMPEEPVTPADDVSQMNPEHALDL